jgi:hypothetical protein
MKRDMQIIKKQCDELIKFLKEKGGGEMMISYEKILEQTYFKKDKKGLIIILKDLSEWVSGFSRDGKEKVNLILASVENENKEKVLEILEMGKISSEDEYEIILNFVDRYFQEPNERINVEKSNQMLLEYDLSGK